MEFGTLFGDFRENRYSGIVASRIRAAQVAQLYFQSLPGLIGALLSAVILTAALREVVPLSHLLVWLGVYVAAQLPRYGLLVGFHKARPTGDDTIPWGRWFAVTTVVSCLIWGLAGIFLYPKDSLVHQFLMALFLAGIAAAATVVYSPSWPTCLLAVLAEACPISGRLLYEGDEVHVIMGAVTGLFGLVLVMTGRNIHRLHADSARLGLENSDLVDSLILENARVDELNKCLKDEIVERKKAETALLASQERLGYLVSSGPAVIYSFKPREGYEVTSMSPNVRAQLGWGSDEFIGRERLRSDLIHPEDLKEMPAALSILWARGSHAAEYRFLHKDGTYRWMRDQMNLARDRHGAPLEVIGSWIDITDRKETEQALRESEERYRGFLQNFQGIAYRGDLDFRPIFFHGAVEAISGYKAEDFVLGNPEWHEVIHPEDFAKAAESVERLRYIPYLVSQREYRILRKDGDIRWVWEVISNACDDTGKPLYVQGAIYDITDRKLAEESLRASLDEKEVLFREIHHRVKNNLQVISSLLRLQSRYISDRQYKRMFLESQNRLESMVLVHELLYRSKDLANIDLKGYVNGLVTLLLSSFGISRGRVDFKTEIAPISMSVDTAIPCGLITNELVSNCLKHAFPDGRKGTVEILLSSNGGNFQLVVADNGIGLPADFDFISAQTLGLRLVNTLVKQLRGEVYVSRSGGTEFHIEFKEITHARRS